ncbi:MAG: 50S ribosomal protein L6 [Candidatus Bostrichicola ureolyticus]|nr:MAG: 50S ribosomal protein L6 [Candidatus Bostrichicola ureolyticus]
MSRIGKIPILIPKEVILKIENEKIIIKGPLGELYQSFSNKNIEIVNKNNYLFINNKALNEKNGRSMHGLYRVLINNMIIGVTKGFKKILEIVGIGYKASNKGQFLELSLGYSHNIMIKCPDEIKIDTKNEKGKNPLIILSSYDKQLLGIVADKIRSFRKPEPYKGKGIRYLGENIIRKTGKSA